METTSEIAMGDVVYDVRRVYTGTKALSELLADQISQKFPVPGPVDGPARDGL